MKKQFGGALVVALSLIGALFAIVALVVMVAISANNTANRFEQSIKAEHTNNKNVLSQYNQKILEAAQVPDMMRDDLIKVATATMEGRYGQDGSKALFQMITEQNPNVDAALYTKLQQIIESGRDEFKTSQTRLIDTKRAYTTALGDFPKGPIMSFMGFPRINLDDYNIVTTEGVEQTFKAGKEAAPIKLRPAP
jgi:type II secretory pathway pseudopilin PulG